MRTNSLILSIIVLTYNVSQYLDKSIKSKNNESNYEIILTDKWLTRYFFLFICNSYIDLSIKQYIKKLYINDLPILL